MEVTRCSRALCEVLRHSTRASALLLAWAGAVAGQTSAYELQLSAPTPGTASAAAATVPAAAANAVAGAAAVAASAVAPAFTPLPGVLLAPDKPVPRWTGVPRVSGRLGAADLGLVINTADPYSVAVGEHYIRRRALRQQQVLRLTLPAGAALQPAEFEQLRSRINQHFGPGTQALALAWRAPYAVACNSITGALALGFDAGLCDNGCKPSRLSPYFNSASSRPFADLGLRPAMLLAANSVEQARELIDRGVRADHTLARRNRPPVTVLQLLTNDAARRVRTAQYPPAGALPGLGVQVRVAPAAELATARRVLLVTTGAVRVDFSARPDWVPGGLGDHLTSVGGALNGGHDQGTALDWIASGATASHGTVSEPCNHLQKFPHPQLLLLHYLQGATALEAYWKSVAWPQQSLFVGEPLAAPFAVPQRPLLGAPRAPPGQRPAP